MQQLQRLYGLLGPPHPCSSQPASLLAWCFLMALRTSNVSALSDRKTMQNERLFLSEQGCWLLLSSLFYSLNWPNVLTRKLKAVLRGTKRTLTKETLKELGSMKEAGISIEEDEIWEEHSKELVRSGRAPWSQPSRGAHTLHLIPFQPKAV